MRTAIDGLRRGEDLCEDGLLGETDPNPHTCRSNEKDEWMNLHILAKQGIRFLFFSSSLSFCLQHIHM